MTRRMPAEWEPHTRTWMAWPSSGYTLGDTDAAADEARRTWAAVANAVVAHEPLTMVVPSSARDAALAFLDPRVELLEAPLDDAWFRDIGPTFVHTGDRLEGIDWVFNGWGAQEWARWEHDAEAASAALAAIGVPRVASPLVNEGGGIHTDGRGTFLVTETVQRDPGRNPGWTRAQVEEELVRTVGARKVIWLPRGLTRDSDTYGTRGHVDIVACFTPTGRVLLHEQRDPSHPDHAVSAELRALLTAETDADGNPLDVVMLPAPATLRDEEGWVDWSYVNHYVLNGAVVACVFDDAHDEEALAVLAEAYPGRRIVPVDARPLFDRGGGIHCITQQQPAAPPSAA